MGVFNIRSYSRVEIFYTFEGFIKFTWPLAITCLAMKKRLVVVLILALITPLTHGVWAQYDDDVDFSASDVSMNESVVIPKYTLIKRDYNTRLYVPQKNDPYSPTLAGLSSLFIPGLGHMLCGETERGLGFLGASLGSTIVMGLGINLMSKAYHGYEPALARGALLFLAGMTSMCVVDILSIVDAVHVAKVKNMYYKDMTSTLSSMEVTLSPYIGQLSMNNRVVRPVGLSMTVRF